MIMSNVKISLVFCCYNVSSYLDGIYSWLRQQPYENIEVVFVEDCSTDDTKDKLYSIVNDPRMKIIENKKNMGLSESRNIGLSNVTGEYVGFPDPDDMFALNWLEHVEKAIANNHPKVVISGMREDYENDNIIEYSKNIISEFSGYISNNFIDALLDLEKTMLFGYMNNKFYETKFLLSEKINCKTMALKEDFDFNISVFDKIDSFYIINEPFYFYKKRRNGNTLTSKYVPEYFSIHVNSINMLKNTIENKFKLTDSSIELLINRFFRYFLSAIERNTDKRSGMTKKEQIEWISYISSELDYQWYFSNIDSLSGKMKMLRPVFKSKRINILLLIGHLLRFTKGKLPVFFAKMKS